MSIKEFFFFPAMWIMSKLNYYSKMFWLFILAAGLTLTSTYLYVTRLNIDINSAQNKIQALHIANSIDNAVEALQSYRNLGSICMYKSCKPKKVSLAKKRVIESLNALKLYNIDINSTKDVSLLNSFAKIDNYSDEKNYFEFSRNITSLLYKLNQIKYKLTLSLGINNEHSEKIYTLMRNTLFNSHEMLEHFSEADAHALMVLSKKEMDSDDFTYLKESVATSVFLYNQLFETCGGYKGLDIDRNAIESSFENYMDVYESEVFAQSLGYAPDTYLYDSKLFLDHIRMFQHDAVKILEHYYKDEFDNYSRQKNIIILLLVIGSLIWFYFFLGYYIVLKRSIEAMKHITQDVAKGELHKRLTNETDDEFKIIVDLVNSMIGSLENENRMLCEYKKALDASAPICKTNKDGVIIYVNVAYEELTRYSEKELVGNTHAMLRSENSSDIKYQQLWEDINNKKIHRTLFENRDKFGNTFFVQSTIVPVLNKHFQVKEFIAIMNDITDIQLQKTALNFQLTNDTLTGLPNRIALTQQINEQSDVKLMLLDIDRFSDINSIYGEVVADELLKQIGHDISLLLDTTRLSLYKLSADEYAIVADSQVSESDFKEDVIMLSHFLNPIKVSGFVHDISVRISIGAVITSEDKNSRPILSMAKEALQNAKKNPKAYQFFQHNNHSAKRIENNIQMLEYLEYAIENNKVQAHFQPIFSIKENKITKFETLIRIEDPNNNILYPGDFMDIAKHSRLYATLTKLIVKEAINKAIEYPNYKFSVNVSYEDMLDTSTVSTIFELLQSSNVAHRIIFEMLESVEVEENQQVENFIRHVKELGSSIAIDDFGSGYSNYAYLMKSGVDIVKIDGSLISLIDRDENIRKIVDSIIKIANDLDIETVAEFVSSRSIYDSIVDLGIDNVQGSYIAHANSELLLEKKF